LPLLLLLLTLLLLLLLLHLVATQKVMFEGLRVRDMF
jgi:hypothetical protein